MAVSTLECKEAQEQNSQVFLPTLKIKSCFFLMLIDVDNVYSCWQMRRVQIEKCGPRKLFAIHMVFSWTICKSTKGNEDKQFQWRRSLGPGDISMRTLQEVIKNGCIFSHLIHVNHNLWNRSLYISFVAIFIDVSMKVNVFRT